ncbi:histidine phosphatase family protein [Ureibacillus sp. FSL K6-8385]|nr:histidine phosphatase family protein [Ureibacillus terrenus]MED3660502.1 histidine phosphatase family protein [Ureibacillus terrenus]MED3762655.1 histidine phosphatase family protein [Ureibacillus terrenus]
MENRLELYFVRHGETEWNREGRLQGWLDSELTPRGIGQVKQLKEHLKDVQFDCAFSSPSTRAYDTAYLLVGHYLPIKRDPRLLEIHLGTWQGKRIAELEKGDLRYRDYIHNPERYLPDTGESFQQVISRMVDFMKSCQRNFPTGKILAVSHGVAIRAAILSILELPVSNIWDFHIDGASVTKMVIADHQWSIEYIGKTFSVE